MPTQEQIAAQKEQVAAYVAALQAALHPASLILKGPAGDRNGNALHGELTKRHLANTIDNVVLVINEILLENKLEWEIKPKKLVLYEKNDAPKAKESPLQLEAERAALIKKTEEAEAKSKADAKCWERINLAVENFNPRKASAKIDERAKLRAHVERERARNANPEGVFEAIRKYIDDFYKNEERAASQSTTNPNKMAY